MIEGFEESDEKLVRLKCFLSMHVGEQVRKCIQERTTKDECSGEGCVLRSCGQSEVEKQLRAWLERVCEAIGLDNLDLSNPDALDWGSLEELAEVNNQISSGLKWVITDDVKDLLREAS